ncbi:hypothetical protein IQ07DRAFT_121260 [Pyrenochaeta sp. DS3sAY3a]|nr:hypothetical protein IQ07DRAFT_121260 [Pyrenochaeta sp. DS3sAY3a]
MERLRPITPILLAALTIGLGSKPGCFVDTFTSENFTVAGPANFQSKADFYGLTQFSQRTTNFLEHENTKVMVFSFHTTMSYQHHRPCFVDAVYFSRSFVHSLPSRDKTSTLEGLHTCTPCYAHMPASPECYSSL